MATHLPIESVREELLDSVQSCNRLVLTAPAGAGKSTQVPQMLLDGLPEQPGAILVLQPRRLAARMLAKRVAAERRKPLGGEVGFQVRFQEKASADTRILYITEGLFWRRLVGDPGLPGIRAVLFDEFHERHMAGDLALSRIIDIQKSRPDLLVGVMSATLETALVEEFLQPCRALRCEGRSFPVVTEYSEDGTGPDSRPIWEKVARRFPQVLKKNPEGDVLVFMPGAYEIRRSVEALQLLRETRDMDVLSLHGEMPPEQQDRVLENTSRRKIIVATNVAETSLTIEGVRTVVDSGLARVFRFDSRRGVDTLVTERVSQSSAEQRAGRAGRVAPGYCLRLWKEQEQSAMPVRTEPEIHRIDLAPSLLELRVSGVDDPTGFNWLEAPESVALEQAEQALQDLGAVDPQSGSLAEDGRRMAAFPLHPRYARLLLEGEKRGCLGLVCQLAAFVQGRNLLLPLRESRKERDRQELLRLDEMPGSDFFYLYKAFNLAAENRFSMDFCREWGIHAVAAREAWQAARQFLDLARGQGMHFSEEDVDLREVRKCLLAAFPQQVARRLDRGTLRCALPGGRRGELRRTSVADGSSLVVVAEVEEVVRNHSREMLLGLATEVEDGWLEELFPGRFSETSETLFDERSRRVVVRRGRRVGGLVLEEGHGDEPDESRAAELLAEAVLSAGLKLRNWDASVEQWIERVNFVARQCTDYGVARIDEEARRMLLQEVCLGAMSYRDIKNREVMPVLWSWLADGLAPALDALAPVAIEVPGRRKPVAVKYADGEARIALTVQEMMKLDEHPVLAADAYALPIEVLAPSRRPVQVTTDLAGFWKDSYPEVRKQLRGRYPKHDWPEVFSLRG